MDFKLGDVVQLKSGGPSMTVEAISGNDVVCIWFDKMKAHRKSFPAIAVEKNEGFGVA